MLESVTERGVASAALAEEATAPALAEARIDWRTVVAVGWTLEAWTQAIALFGDLVELLPEPSSRDCWRADDDDWLLRLRCAYWDWKDASDDRDDHDDEHDEDARADEGSSDDSRGDESDDPWGSPTGGWDDDDDGSAPSDPAPKPDGKPGLGG
ncbi:MAG: hypothetical protein ABW252_03540 [Polyangiales bacterium]